MRFTEATLEDCLYDARKGLQLNASLWQDGEVPVDGVTNITYTTAKDFELLAKCGALLGAVRQSREWFGEAARQYLEHVHAGRLRRDIRERSGWEGEPRMLSRALNAALLSRDETRLAEIATVTLEMDESYLDAFADEYLDSSAHFYNVKVRAALVLDDDQAPNLIEQFRERVARLTNPSQFWKSIPEYYQALVDESAPAAEAALADLFEYYAEEKPDPDDPGMYVLHTLCAHVLLARRCGLDVSLESDRLPSALLRDDIPDDDVELDIDLSDLRFTSRVGYFELDRDDDGSPIIAGRMYHPGGDPVSAADVPERESGQLLSDEWIEAALDEAAWRDLAEEELIAEAADAFEVGTLKRKLVVIQDRTDGYTFDESLAELPVDDIELLKGAGRR